MALTHYNSLIKAHPAVTAALGSINTHTHTTIWESKSLFTHTHTHTQEKQNSQTWAQHCLLARSSIPIVYGCCNNIYHLYRNILRCPVGEDFWIITGLINMRISFLMGCRAKNIRRLSSKGDTRTLKYSNQSSAACISQQLIHYSQVESNFLWSQGSWTPNCWLFSHDLQQSMVSSRLKCYCRSFADVPKQLLAQSRHTYGQVTKAPHFPVRGRPHSTVPCHLIICAGWEGTDVILHGSVFHEPPTSLFLLVGGAQRHK